MNSETAGPDAKIFISPESFQRDSWRLAAAVVESSWRPDFLVALWRGGAAAGVSVHEFFKASGWDVRHVPLKCSSYTGIGANSGEVVFTLGDETFALFGRGDRVLVVDDVFDTGKTARAVKARMDAAGAEMRMACVYWKPSVGADAAGPDYFVRRVGGEWIVFPHEIDGLSKDEISAKDPVLAELLARR